ncbi:MAG: alpha/beta fold hydrolase [Rhodoferax sp.]
MGYEANCTYEAYTQLAENLANAGFDVLRFDYHGTGDSAGSDADAHRVRAWIDSTTLAIHELKQLAGVSSISLFGVRLGATLAAHAASELGGIESMVMWAPCATGRAFARELRAASASRSEPESSSAPDNIEAFGHLYTAETLQDLNALDCQRLDPPPAKRVMMIGRDDMPSGEGPLPGRYKEMGVDITYAPLPGYAGMMRDPHEAMIERPTLARIVDWFCAIPPSPNNHTLQNVLVARPPSIVNAVSENVREIPLKYGPAQSLFGILTEPTERATHGQRSETVVLMINVGGHCHTGPSRIYVNMARSWAASGYRAFRLDVNGIGDSRSQADLSACNLTSLYSTDYTADVRAAIDCLAAQGCKKFIIMGICSGSYIAFHTTQADVRVNGQILLNSLRLEPPNDNRRDHWESASQATTTYKGPRHYLRALSDPIVYKRAVLGQVNVRYIAIGLVKRYQAIVAARLRRAANRLLQRTQDEAGTLHTMKRLTARGVNTLVIVAADDPARDFIDFNFGKNANYMHKSPNFQLIVMKDADHTFSTQQNQCFAATLICDYLGGKNVN